jgi:hypothetical protein
MQLGLVAAVQFPECLQSPQPAAVPLPQPPSSIPILPCSHPASAIKPCSPPPPWCPPMCPTQAFRTQLESGAVAFADLAKVESHCSSARAGGDLGWFG